MIRETTALPRRPKAEAALLDDMLKLLRLRMPMRSDQIVRLVQKDFKARKLSIPCAVDIRLMLQKPYFTLQNDGWVCKWRM